jgi:hypothetical protein
MDAVNGISIVGIIARVIVGIIVGVIRITPIIGITPVPPPRDPRETEPGNKNTVIDEKTALAVKMPETPAVKASKTPAVKGSETTSAAKASEITPAVKASPSMKPASSAEPPVSDCFGR